MPFAFPRDALKTRAAASLLILANLWIASAHGEAHDVLEIFLPTGKQNFVWLSVVIAPLLAGALLWTRWFRPALWLLGIAMIAAAAFGILHHYIFISPDNIEHLPHGSDHDHGVFIGTAAWLAVLQTTLAAVCLYVAGYWWNRPDGQAFVGKAEGDANSMHSM